MAVHPSVQSFGKIMKWQELVQFTETFWVTTGQKLARAIQLDAKKGILQEPLTAHYISEQYKKYKASRFNRLTGRGKVAGYKGQRMASTRTESVDMTLTGALMKGLHVDKAYYRGENQGVDIKYNDVDGYKIQHNETLGRDVRTWNDKNENKMLRLLAREVGKNIEEATKQDLTLIFEM